MRQRKEELNFIDLSINQGKQNRSLQVELDNTQLNGRLISIDNRDVINFGSCSYLGLETDSRVKQGVIDAVNKYGTQLSSSVAYISAPPYSELREMLEQLFEAHVLITPTTTLGHLAVLPTVINENDLVILDQQAHFSVQMATNYTKLHGATVELIRHNVISQLENYLQRHSDRFERIWYLADGVYSMYGDFAPIDELMVLLNKYPKLHLYIDDAHGMSWVGKQGRGSILGKYKIHERMIVAVSLNKSFAGSGGAILFPNPELRQRVRNCGGPMTFSGPIQPPMLGALCASAKLHLSPEIHELQNELQELISYCNQLLSETNLPLISTDKTPVRYIGLGRNYIAMNMTRRLLKQGFFVNLCMFPAVSVKRGGVRFTLNRHLKKSDISDLIQAISENFPKVLAEEGSSMEELSRAFKNVLSDEALNKLEANQPQSPKIAISKKENELSFSHYTSINEISKDEWDPLLGSNGSFTWEGLNFLEDLFSRPREQENTWKFHYFIVRQNNKPVLATFFTESLWKDDLLLIEEVSREIEKRRQKDPYYLTSWVLNMGSLFTEGCHLFLDRNLDWQSALNMFLKEIVKLQENCNANQIVIRDIPVDDHELYEIMTRQGFSRMMLPDNMSLDINWQDEESYLKQLTRRSRNFQQKEVMPWDHMYRIEVLTQDTRKPTKEELAHLYWLYKQTKDNALAINTYDMPTDIFEYMLRHNGWEIVLLYLTDPAIESPTLPVAMGCSYRWQDQYCSLVAGIDSKFAASHCAYRQLLRQVIKRAHSLGCKKMFLGYDAALEKHRFGADANKYCLYTLVVDHYNFEVISQIEKSTQKKEFVRDASDLK